ncbi:tetratricopeptide repeat protein [Falsiphaeobacter marinintestinus]|uniref:tetratricopeptide repeat protein n=1 Tax=Falsiphaeobacter marinintestinus TaxID=1492905 RepID=UPI0011B4EC5B|nr:tetratricopeptide repeat protein [Phaeobacter marinintestinus]
MTTDIFGTDVSLTTPASLEDWNAVMLGFMAHSEVTPKHLTRLLESEPEFAMGHAIKGLFYMLMGRRELVVVAETAMADALAHAETACPRERIFIKALSEWMDGRPTGSIQCLETALNDNAQDTLAMKLSQAIRFVLGDVAGMLESVQRVLPAYAPDHPGRGYLLGCHAFALEENGDYTKAEIAGRQALWMAPDDAWGLHAVAHVYDMTCDAKAGLDWLSGRENAWAHCNNFKYHVWWHKALMHLDLGQVDEVLDLYDRQIRADKTDDYRDISNATSLLMRLELDGVPVGNRWEELAALSANRTQDGCLIFADLHYLLALNGGDRAEDRSALVQRIHRDAQTSGCDMRARMANPGEAASLGLEAFGETRFDEAFAYLAQARGTMQLAGGSHAQRDVFERLTIDAGLRAGQLDRVEIILNERQAQRGGREDGYAVARRDLIAAGRGSAHRVPAQ